MTYQTNTTSTEHAVVVVDDNGDDSDNYSTFSSDIESTASLTSSIKNHTYENGRRYHSYRAGTYLAPNDEDENNRLDMHHHLATLLLEGELHVAPIGSNPQNIIDVGCGTGIWSIETGDAYPSAHVLGVDLSPTQPSMVPPNVSFELDDVEEEWTYRQQFDLVHSRFMTGSIGDWPKFVRQAYRHTKPGGWCEFKDFDITIRTGDNSLPKGSYLLKYHNAIYEAMDKLGRDYASGPKLKGWIEEAGYSNVKEKVLPVPIGTWAKDEKLKTIGLWNYACLEVGLEAICLRLLTSVLGWKVEEIHVLLAQVRKELKDRSIHAQYTYYIVYGQKLKEAET